ncbi:BON domain-containing protein [Biostraticola tofi]|uniref:Osmotically-inducible protein Y n=1 Tax=Biostraticola tofi TaxID=466109 RepID=A0A4R3Z606_9GAMM|nr:BON domain-containing protein [Biostraticola tofi]TCV99914.1 BON domain-containing protein [Biostraticola tofi]
MKMLKTVATLAISALLTLAITGCAPTAKSEGTGGYIDDTVVTTKVKTELLRDETLKSREINVETFKGRVQLSGFVGSQAEANRAVSVTRTVKGVKSVENDISIK